MSSQLSAELELELEQELEHEHEHEFEAELEGEFEQELASELEQELEYEGSHELEHAQEAEHEAFFNSLAAMADRGGRSQALRRIAIAAARAALRANRQPVPPIEGEAEFEAMPELELEFNPARQALLTGQMEHAGHAAAEAATEQEAAEHFLPLIGLAAKFVVPKLAGMVAKKIGGKMLGKVAGKLVNKVGGRVLGKLGGKAAKFTRGIGRMLGRRVRRTVPQLNRAVANTTRALWRHPSTRPLVHAMPHVARRTIAQVARRAALGRPVSPQAAVRTFARNTLRTLGNPRVLHRTYRRSLWHDQRYHRHNRQVIGQPVDSTPVHGGIPGHSHSHGSPATAPAPVCTCGSAPIPPPMCPGCGGVIS